MQSVLDSIMSASLGTSTYETSMGVPGFKVKSQTAFYDSGMSQSNTSITHAYTLMPFASGLHTRLAEGSIVFCARYIDPKVPLYGLMSIGQINAHLKELHRQFKAMEEDGNADANTLRAFLQAPDAERKMRLGEAPKEATKDVLYAQSVFGITRRWNYLGVLVSTQRSEDSIQSSYAAPVLNAAVVLGERAMVTNYWEPTYQTHVGSKLYLVLERTGNDGPFQFRPFAPPMDKSKFPRDPKKKYYMVGTLTQAGSKTPAPRAVDMALGADGEQAAHEATGSIELVCVQLGI
jgi:hypothetical protein